MPTRKNFRDRVKKRREEAVVRQELRDKRTSAEQFARLAMAGHGKCKESQKLYRKMLENK